MSFYGGGYQIVRPALKGLHALDLKYLENQIYNDECLKDLRKILDYPSESYMYCPVNYPDFYQKTLDVIIKAKMTEVQLKKICAVFKEKGKLDDKRFIRVLRRFHLLDPSQKIGLHQIVWNLHKPNMWGKIKPQLTQLFPNHHELIVKEYQNSLESFNFEEMKGAPNKDKVFNRKLNQLQRIFEYRAHNKLEKCDENILKELIEVELTGPQENKLCAIVENPDKIKVFRQIFHYQPQNQGELKEIINNLLKNDLWKQVEPKLGALSPNYHKQITDAYLDRIKPLNVRFHEMLEGLKLWNDARGSKKAVEGFQNFKQGYEKDPDYKKLDWELLYKLIREKSCLMSRAEREQLISIYVQASNSETNLKAGILSQYFESGRTNGLNLKKLFETSNFYHLDEMGMNEIAELCSEVELNTNEENGTWDLFSGKSRDQFLLERIKRYCRYISDKDYKGSKYWNLEALKAFFGSICSKLYYKQIQESTFRDIIACVCNHLSPADRNEMIKAPEFNSCSSKIHYDCCFVMAECKKLEQKETEGNNGAELLKSIKENLKVLMQKHVTSYTLYAREITYGQILSVFSYIQALNLSEASYRSILEIFRGAKKDANSIIGMVRSEYDKEDWYGVKTSPATSEKGEISDPFFNTIQAWVEANRDWIEANSQEDKRCPNLLNKVKELLKLLKGVDLLSSTTLLEYNQNLQEASLAFWTAFRNAIQDKMFISGHERLLTLGPKEAGFSVVLLNEIYKMICTSMNVLPFYVKEMKEAIPLCLEELSKSKREIKYMAERELLKFSNPLQLPFEIQNEVIERLNIGNKTPLLNLLESIPFKYLSLTYLNADGKENNVDLFRMPPLVGPHGINPKFFLGNAAYETKNRFLFISLEDNPELLKLKSNNVFVANFSVKGDFFHQENEYATPSLLFVTVKGQLFQQVLKPGMLPEAWLDDETFKKTLETCMDQIKAILYPNQSSLDPGQRRILIKFFYLRLAFYLISYTNVSNFGFISNGQEVFNSLMAKLLTTLFDNKDLSPPDQDFTYGEMERALSCGAKLSKPDELSEAFAVLDLPEVKERLRAQNPFLNQKMDYPDFKVRQLLPNEPLLLENPCRVLSLMNNT